MIPKIIHYCWYGKGSYSPEIEMCIESWKKYCPGWEIRLWNEENTPMGIKWIHDAYKHRKYAFVADYVRFYTLYNYGGIYLDTDMLLIKPLDSLLSHRVFLGKEDAYNANMAIFGAEKGNQFCYECLELYNSTSFNLASLPIITRFITPKLFQFGFTHKDETQCLTNGIVVYSSDWFYPIHYSENFEIADINQYIKPNTIGVHLWNKSWRDELQMLYAKEYKKGFRIAFKRILRTPFLPIKYYKKLVKYLIYWITGK